MYFMTRRCTVSVFAVCFVDASKENPQVSKLF